MPINSLARMIDASKLPDARDRIRAEWAKLTSRLAADSGRNASV
jgi:hypothetical protein